MMTKNIGKQHGSVSLFVVIFAALLITVVTVSFVRIMIQDQQQATATDLSQSAYDSAQAGVEDAKRAILRYQTICDNGGGCSPSSQDYKQIHSTTCNTAVSALKDVADSIDAISGEVKIQTNVGNVMDQAYTCVKINLQTDDYMGTLNQDTNKLVPLIGASDFDTIYLEWFSAKDLQGTDMLVNVPKLSDGAPLLSQAIWTSNANPNRPSIMRAQLIQFNSVVGFSLNGGAEPTNNTLFLYPSDDSSGAVEKFTNDTRKATKDIKQISCKNSLINDNYSCSVTIELPTRVAAGYKTTYLNLETIYKKTNYRITLKDSVSATLVKFDGVQPEIDSTGRANDLFRRVQTRVELDDINFPYPVAAVDLSGNFCKDFVVTNNPVDYDGDKPGKCQP